MNYFVYPYAELDGKPFTEVKSDISFRDGSAGAAASAAGNSR